MFLCWWDRTVSCTYGDRTNFQSFALGFVIYWLCKCMQITQRLWAAFLSIERNISVFNTINKIYISAIIKHPGRRRHLIGLSHRSLHMHYSDGCSGGRRGGTENLRKKPHSLFISYAQCYIQLLGRAFRRRNCRGNSVWLPALWLPRMETL